MRRADQWFREHVESNPHPAAVVAAFAFSIWGWAALLGNWVFWLP